MHWEFDVTEFALHFHFLFSFETGSFRALLTLVPGERFNLLQNDSFVDSVTPYTVESTINKG